MKISTYNTTTLLFEFWLELIRSKTSDVSARHKIVGWTRSRGIDIVILQQGDDDKSDLIRMVDATGSNVLPESVRINYNDGVPVYLRFFLRRPAFAVQTVHKAINFG